MDLVTILISVVVILFLANVYNNQKRQKHKNLPPGPKPLPIIGNLHMIDMKHPYKTFLEMSKKYGTVLTIHLGMGKIIVLCGYDTVKDALLTHGEEFANRPKLAIFSKSTKDNGVIFSNGESWKAMRRFTLSTLRDYGMGKKAIEEKISEEAEHLVQAMKSYEGKAFDNLNILNAAVANIIISIILGHRFSYDDPTILKLMGLINENIKLMGSYVVRLYNIIPTLLDLLPGPHHKVFENMRQMLNFIEATFTKQKQTLDVNDQRNLIDAFLVKQQEGKTESSQHFNNDNLIALVSDLFVAGMETTTTTLRWAILLMMKYPEIQKKVQNEIDNVIGTVQPQAEHRKQMPYTDAVVHEIQRFGDIVPDGAPHETVQDITFRGYFIPKGTAVFPSMYSVLKDEAYFQKPFDFYPEHFLDAEGNFKKNEAFIPFSIGKRSCAGETLAKMELFLFFTSLLQNFNFQAPAGVEIDLEPAEAGTHGPKPYQLCAIPRRHYMGIRVGYQLAVLKGNMSLFSRHTLLMKIQAMTRILQLTNDYGSLKTFNCIIPKYREKSGWMKAGTWRCKDQIGSKDIFSSEEKYYRTMFAVDPMTILLSVAVILFLAYVYNSKKADKYKNFPPGPKPLPVIGNALNIDMKKPHMTFIELSKTYGPVIGVQMGMEKTVVLCGYDTLKDALVNHAEDFSDRPKTPWFPKTISENGIVFSNGENWKVMRRFTLSTLRDYGMGRKTIEDKICEEAEYLVQAIQSCEGKAFDNQIIINAAVANIIISILLSRRFEYEDPTLQKLMTIVNENLRLLASPMIRLYNSFPFLIGLLPGSHKKIVENSFQTQHFIRETFTKQRKELDVNDQRNLIDTFLAKQQEGKPESSQYYHDENLTALVDNLFVAGMETTTTTLRWGLLLMMKYPDIQKKVQNEMESVIGTTQPRLEHRKQMPYTDAVIHEILRYGDIAPTSVPHATSRDVTFRGYFIPKGTTVIPVLSSSLRDKAYFEKPYEFYPEHFLDKEGNFKKNDAFIPFSIGKRSCAGETLAKMELFLFFTILLQHFTFQAPPGGVLDLTPAVGAANAPLPHEICAIPRI
ncbi:uncharacterized protein ACMZJ9_007485 [Mantella aurantiaca]